MVRYTLYGNWGVWGYHVGNLLVSGSLTLSCLSFYCLLTWEWRAGGSSSRESRRCSLREEEAAAAIVMAVCRQENDPNPDSKTQKKNSKHSALLLATTKQRPEPKPGPLWTENSEYEGTTPLQMESRIKFTFSHLICIFINSYVA